MQNDIAIGTSVTVKVEGKLVQGVYDGFNTKYNLPYVKLESGSRVLRRVLSLPGVPTSTDGSESASEVSESVQSRTFDINTRFLFLEKLVKMVADGPSNSLIVSGSGGLGKSFTVKKIFSECGLVEDEHYMIVKGYATPKSLYRKLCENPDMTIVFDDCDSVLKDQNSVNILKAALDSEPVRTVCWLIEGESDLPKSFDFTGKIVFLTNLDRSQVPQALISRAQVVDIGMTPDEKIDRMRAIIEDVRTDLHISVKNDVIDFLHSFRHRMKDLNMRTLLKVLDIRISEPTIWKDIAEYSITL